MQSHVCVCVYVPAHVCCVFVLFVYCVCAVCMFCVYVVGWSVVCVRARVFLHMHVPDSGAYCPVRCGVYCPIDGPL